VLPDVLARRLAAERRRAFRYALSSYLDLVNVILAAGAGVETALSDAADAGHGWAFNQLRSTLARARLAGESPWRAFARLGEELDLPELRETASGLALAGTHGARVRASLQARAQAMRNRDLADMEGHAEAATERMSVPSVVLVVGFIVFVGYPAAYEILGF
jgi:tight adherence protein C